ncbi:hypothetical protein [Micromonospora sp. CPCC 205558]|uniref:hypothetical protein n=1 Tax=Micromonospora sp. CPCC 205558 TaxID=3122403 RepID=UPI002FF0ECCF
MTFAGDDLELDRLARLHLSAARATLEHWRTADAFEVERGLLRKFNATYSLVAHSMAQVAASLALHDHHLTYAARVNVRVALEHALAAQWIVHTNDGEDEVIGSMNRIHRNMVRDLQKGGTVIPPQMQSDLHHPPGEPQVHILAISDWFDGGTGAIYGLYRQLSGAVHVSLATLTTYLEWRGERETPALRPDGVGGRDPEQDFALGWSAVLAMSAIERLRSGQPYLGKIYKISDDHELVPDLRRAEPAP